MNECKHGNAGYCALCNCEDEEHDAAMAGDSRRELLKLLDDGIAKMDAQAAENVALRKDAERYRWLRDGCNDKQSAATRIAVNRYGMEWDAAIDAAMKEKT